MGLTLLGTPLTMTHHIYSDDFQELLPLSIHGWRGLFLGGRNFYDFGQNPWNGIDKSFYGHARSMPMERPTDDYR